MIDYSLKIKIVLTIKTNYFSFIMFDHIRLILSKNNEYKLKIFLLQ